MAEIIQYIFWDDERGQVVPRPLTRDWHNKYKKMWQKNRDELERFKPIGEYSEAAMEKASKCLTLQAAKDAIAGKVSAPVDPYADTTTEPEVIREPETPAAKPYTKAEIMKMVGRELGALLTDFGIPSRKMKVAEMKDKLIEITAAE